MALVNPPDGKRENLIYVQWVSDGQTFWLRIQKKMPKSTLLFSKNRVWIGNCLEESMHLQNPFFIFDIKQGKNFFVCLRKQKKYFWGWFELETVHNWNEFWKDCHWNSGLKWSGRIHVSWVDYYCPTSANFEYRGFYQVPKST